LLQVTKNLLQFLTPNRCACLNVIHVNSAFICSGCFEKVEFVSTQKICPCCGIPSQFDISEKILCSECIADTPHFDCARSVFKYNDFIGTIISGLKYSDKTPFAKNLADNLKTKLSEIPDFDLICSVPIHRKKLISRKYNQSALLANWLGKKTSKKVNNLVLIKTKHTQPQAGLHRKERIANIKNTFSVNKKYLNQIKGKNILIIDDVITTGATASECTKILKKNGAEKVFVLTVARTVLEN
jgi:ComF family protein